MKRSLLFTFIVFTTALQSSVAQYYSSTPKKIPAYNSDVYDTIAVSGLSPAILNGTWGLDSITLNLAYDFTPDLQISVIAPDGTVVHLSNNHGYGADYTNASFSMHSNSFVQFSPAPFTGDQQPESWLGMVNNGNSGNGNWQIRIINQNVSIPDSGTLINWGLHFSNTPAPPNFFDSSTLPIVVINTPHDTVIAESGAPVVAHMGIISNSGINHLSDPFNNYNANIEINVRGGTSREFPSKSYSVSTKDVANVDSDAVLLGMPADHSWILYAPWNDKTMIRNYLTYRLSNEMGEYAVRTRYCQVVINGDYKGVYMLMEKISRGTNRVNVKKMTTADTTGKPLTGGYIFQTDRGNYLNAFESRYKTCDTTGIQPWYVYTYPKIATITDSQKNYIATYIDSFETEMKFGNLYDTVNGYRKYIDVPSIIDMQLLQELGHNVDAYRLSTFFHKDRSSKVMGGPIWDFNEAFGNASDDEGYRYDTYEWNVDCSTFGEIPFWWKKITTDTLYFKELQCRYSNLRLNVLDTTYVQGLIDSITTALTIPAQEHYTRWQIMGLHTWANYFVGNSYTEETDYLKSWVRNRINFMDSALFNPACIDTTKPPTLRVVSNADNSIKIYPNPANDYLNITCTASINKVVIYNVLGQQVYESNERNNHYSISLRQYHLTNGIYTVSVFSDAGMVRRKIVVID